MSDFPPVSLGECCEVISGATPKTSVSDYWDGEVLWATPKDLSGLASKYIDDTSRKITEAGLRSCAARVLPEGSVLFSSRAPIGHVAINTRPMATNQGFKSLVPISGKADAGYLYHWLKTHRSYLEGLGNGATFKELSKSAVEAIEIPLPPLPEQLRIAHILDIADRLCESRRVALGLLVSLSRSVFLETFGDPGANPHRWEVKEFGSLLQEPPRNGLSPSTGGVVQSKVLTLSAITGWRFRESAYKISTFKSTPPARQTVNRLDFLVCRGNGNINLMGRGFFPTRDMPDTTFPDTMIAARVDSMLVMPEFLEHIWNMRVVRDQLKAAARTTNGTFKINQKALEAVKLIVPAMREQERFADRVHAIRRLGEQQASQLRVLTELLDSLQHRAFRGEL